MVTAIDPSGGRVTVTTRSGSRLRADRVLVAAGAFTNFNDLLPVELPVTIETEVIGLGRVSAERAGRLMTTPTLKYLIDDPVLDSIYMVPPTTPGARWAARLVLGTARSG